MINVVSFTLLMFLDICKQTVFEFVVNQNVTLLRIQYSLYNIEMVIEVKMLGIALDSNNH